MKRDRKTDPAALNVGDKVECKNFKDLKNYALMLSSLGYGVAVIGFQDMSDDILTITAVPQGGKGEDH